MHEIKYWGPVHCAWNKMRTVLFHPFDLGKWFVIGFAAFLANCGRNGGSGGGNSFSNSGSHTGRNYSGHDIQQGLSDFTDYCMDVWYEHAHLVLLILTITVILVVGLTILMNWLNSRGQFVFLDNILNNRGAISEPWSLYSKPANSLMWLQVCFDFTVLALGLVLLAGLLIPVFIMLIDQFFSAMLLSFAIAALLLLIIFCLCFNFLRMILAQFIVPLMYKYHCSFRDAAACFAPVFKNSFWRLVLFGLVLFLVNTAIGMTILIGGLLTCCVGFFVIIIPYLGTVVLLPVFVFRRFIGLEFLRQFGEEFDLLRPWYEAEQMDAVSAADVQSGQ